MKEQLVHHEEPEVGASRDMSPIQECTWNPADIGRALSVSPAPRIHHDYGNGFDYELGPDPDAGLTIFPDDNSVQFISGDVVLGFYDIEAPILRSDGVIFESRTPKIHSTLVVRDTGEITFISARAPKADPWDAPQHAPEPQRAPPTVTESSTPVEQPERPPQTATNGYKDSSNTKQETERQEKVNVVGRAGRDPRVTRTKAGDMVAKFPLAEHVTDDAGADQTKWHNVVAFKTRAADVAATVKKGQTLRVIGYLHEKPGRNGKTEHEIYAAVVKPSSKAGVEEGK